jgi:stage II sporulation protein R
MKRNFIRTIVTAALLIFISGGWIMLLSIEHQEKKAALDGNGLIRLHIIANSDSEEDQQVKLRVRDAVVAFLTPRLDKSGSVDDARQVVLANKDQIIKIAADTVASSNAVYKVDMEIGQFDFPVRSYGTLVLPAGKYEAVRLLLGKAEGKNWWCVLFPPLCFVDATGKVAVPAPASADTTSNPPKVELRWKLAEMWENHNGN